MRVQVDNHTFHTTYCLNIHPGETWEENFAAIRTQVLEVRAAVCPARPFGLGLRLSARAAEALSDERELRRFREFLEAEDLYVFTINAFPYGTFHGQAVREAVYRPDWSSGTRLAYTLQVARILAALLPAGIEGSISTVPGAYRTSGAAARLPAMLEHLALAAVCLHELEAQTGRRLCLALEPEPDCVWDRAGHLEELFTRLLPAAVHKVMRERGTSGAPEAVLRRHLGVCLDTCHALVLFADPLADLGHFFRAGIRVPKVQVSAAPRAFGSRAALDYLALFAADSCYLHQSAIRTASGDLLRFADLAPALATAADLEAPYELRTHFHLPLVMETFGALRSTREFLVPELWRMAAATGVSQLEVETYTFEVLPEALRRGGVVRNVVGELKWLLGEVGGRS